MRAATLAGVLALACAAQPGPAPAPAPPPPGPAAPALAAPAADDGELRLLIAPRKDTELVTIALRWDTGAVDDPAGKRGLGALVARLVAEGGTRDLTPAQLQRALFPLAAQLEVQADLETTTILVRVHAREVQRLLGLLEGLLGAPRWDPRELERLRADAVSHLERQLRVADDEELGKAGLDLLLYGGHPYGAPAAGTVRGLRAITLADAREHFARLFGWKRLTIGLSGAATDALAADVRARLARRLAPGEPRRTATPAPPPPGPHRALVIKKETRAVAISMGFPIGVLRDSPDYAALRVAMSAFGEHRQSNGRLYQRLRELRGLNYGDYAYIERYHQDGHEPIPQPGHPRRHQLFNIWIRPVEPAAAVFAVRAALYELRRLVRDGIGQPELDRTVGFLRGYSLLWDATDRLRIGWALDDAFYGIPAWPTRFRRELGAMTPERVNAAVRRHLDPERLRFVFVARDAEGLARALASGAPSPIKYASPRPPAVLEEDRAIEALPLGLGSAAVRTVDARTLFEE